MDNNTRCARCKFGLRLSELETGCQYMLMTGKSKVAQVYKQLGITEMNRQAWALLQSRNCPFFIWDGVTRSKGRAHGNSKFDWVKALELYKKGASTAEIARELGAKSSDPVYEWMRRAGLKPNVQKREKIDKAEMEKLYLRGMTDKEIAAELSCCIDTVRSWRLRLDLAPNRKHKGSEA